MTPLATDLYSSDRIYCKYFTYRKSNSETMFQMIKAKFGDKVKYKNQIVQENN